MEFGADTEAELDDPAARAEGILSAGAPIRLADFTRDPEQIEVAWTVREGLHGLIGRLRPPARRSSRTSACRLSASSRRDIQVPRRARLPHRGRGLHLGWNLHFMLTDFSKREDLDRYEAFMEKLVELVLDKYDGFRQGRARHRYQHGSPRRARVGQQGDRADVAREGARRSRRRARRACCWNWRPGVHGGNPEDDTADRGGRDQLRRMRLAASPSVPAAT